MKKTFYKSFKLSILIYANFFKFKAKEIKNEL